MGRETLNPGALIVTMGFEGLVYGLEGLGFRV